MSTADEDKRKKYLLLNAEEDETGEDGSGTSTGAAGSGVEFHDFLAPQPAREFPLSLSDQRRLLAMHDEVHKNNVLKQKSIKEDRKQIREKNVKVGAHRWGYGTGIGTGTGVGGGQNQYKNHPTLSNKAQFSGIDKQINPLATDNVSDTNNADRNELQNQYTLRYAPELAPGLRFNPKPQFRG
jgi:hypothetical protein